MSFEMMAWRMLIAAGSMCLVASLSHAGDQGDPETSCDGNTFQMVECLKAKTAQWDNRLNVAYQQALKDAVPQPREQLRNAQRLWIGYRDAGRGHYRPARCRRMHAQHDRSARQRAGKPRPSVTKRSR